MAIDEQTIAAKIGQAEFKVEQVAILALSNNMDKQEIRDIAIKHGVLLPWSEEKAKELYDQGYTDKQLANAFGFTKQVLSQWREKYKLPPQKSNPRVANKPFTGKRSKVIDSKAMELYKAGQSDSEIAKVFDISANGIWNWRKKNGLPANKPSRSKKPSKPKTAATPMEVEKPERPAADCPVTPITADRCHCCEKEIPQIVNGVAIITIAKIGTEEYPLCPNCALAFTWAAEKLEAMNK